MSFFFFFSYFVVIFCSYFKKKHYFCTHFTEKAFIPSADNPSRSIELSVNNAANLRYNYEKIGNIKLATMKKHLLLLLAVTVATISAHAFTAHFHAGTGSYDGQNDFSIREASDGAGVTLPTPILADCEGWEFAGWIASGAPYGPTDELTQEIHRAGELYRLSSISEEFYAVYRYKTDTYNDIYVTDQLVSGGQYLILYYDERISVHNDHTPNSGNYFFDKYTISREYSTWGDGYVTLVGNRTDVIKYVLTETNSTNHYWSLFFPFLSKYTDFTNCNGIDTYTNDADCVIEKRGWNTFSLKGVKNSRFLSYGHTNNSKYYFSTKVTETYSNTCNFYILRQQTIYSSTPDCSASNYTVTLTPGTNGTCATASLTESGYHRGVVLPAATPNTGGAPCNALWEFAGWTESGSALATDSTGLPKRLFLEGEVYYPTRNETLHAVYRRKSTNWEQVEDLSTLQAGEKIIIAYKNGSDYYVLSSAAQSEGYNALEAVSGSAISTVDNAALVWTLEGTRGAWRFKDSNGKHLDLTRGDYAYSYTYPWSRWSDEFTISGETNFSIRSNYADKRYLTANATKFSSQAAATSNIHIYRQVTTYSKTPKCENYTVLFNSGEGTFSGVKDATIGVENVSSTTGITLNNASVPTAMAPSCDGWKFAGWRVGSGLHATTSAPGILYKSTDTFIPLQDSITLYAVYQQGDGKVYYERVSTKSEITADGTYVIVSTYNNKAVTYNNNKDSQWSGTDVTVSGDRISSNVNANMQWTYNGTYFYNGNNKLAQNNNANYAGEVTYTNSSFKLQYTEKVFWWDTDYYLRWKTNSGNPKNCFVYGTDNSNNTFQIFKQKTTAPHNSWPHCTPFEVVLNACGGKFGADATKTLKETVADKGVSLSGQTPTTDCDGWSLVGWVEKKAIQARNSAPEGMIGQTASYTPKMTPDQLYAVYSNGTLWSSYPACGEGIEIVEWKPDGIIVESYALTGTPSLNGKNGTANGDGTYTLSYDVASNPCVPILIEWGTTRQIFQTPMLVNSYTRISAVTSAVTNCSTCDMVILNGGTAIADETKTVRDIKIYPGGRFNLASGKTFTANSLTMHTDGDELAPSALIQGTFICPTLNHDRRIDNSRKYWFALPYDVTISRINYVSPSANNGDAVFDDSFYIKFYDGIKRATDKGTSGSYWTYIGEDLEDESYQTKTILKAGRGYLLSIPKGAQNNTGHTYRTLRFPMDVASWASETSVNKTVAAVGKSCDWPQHIGWNLIGNPFLQNYSAVTASDLACGKLTKYYNDKDEWVEPWYTLEDGTGTVPYVTIYDPSTDSYTQTEIIGQNISPFSAVFVQLPDGVTGLRFKGTAINKQSIAARRMGLMTQEEDRTSRFRIRGWSTNEDVFTLIINDKYDDAYEVGADLMKMQNVDRMNLYSHHANGVACAFDALNYTNADSIPVGFVQPANGQFMICAEKVQIAEDVEHLWLIDNETQTKTDLLTDVYTFTADKGTYNNRLWISIGRRADVPTAFPYATELNENSTQKIILNGQMYIIRNGQMYDAVGRLVE